MENFKKINVMPKVVIYKNLLTEPQSILNLFKKSENQEYSPTIFNKWEEWSATESSKGFIMSFDTSRGIPETNADDPGTIIEEKKVINQIYKAFDFAREDFFKDWANKGYWPWNIKNWDFSDTPPWRHHEFNVLEYSSIDRDKKHDPQNGIYNLPMNYHVDSLQSRLDSAGNKLALTFTMYLNDDFDGGEISFYNQDENIVYAYKAKPGDVTVFPSYEPFYHGVLPMGEGKRYLIRMFCLYDYEGSKDWHDNKSKFTEEEWEYLEKNKMEKAYYAGDHNLRILYPGDINTEKRYKTVFVNQPPIIIE